MYIREVKSMVSVDLRSLHKFIENPSLVPRLHPQKEERVWYTLSAFWDVQDAACHVIVMTRHCFGMATHQRLSHAAIVGYSTVSHDNHVQATWRESDWRDKIQKCHVSRPHAESVRCVPDPFLFWGWGLGTRLRKPLIESSSQGETWSIKLGIRGSFNRNG